MGGKVSRGRKEGVKLAFAAADLPSIHKTRGDCATRAKVKIKRATFIDVESAEGDKDMERSSGRGSQEARKVMEENKRHPLLS